MTQGEKVGKAVMVEKVGELVWAELVWVEMGMGAQVHHTSTLLWLACIAYS